MGGKIISGIIMLGILASVSMTAQAPETAVEVIIKTSKGNMTLELYPDKTPLTVKNFLKYVDEKYYDGTIFHRVVRDFMIQGGGWTEELIQKEPTHPPIRNESLSGLKNMKYTIAMGRTEEPHTATCQFFINTVDNPGLDYPTTDDDGFGYCVFGKVTEGTEVVDAIAGVKIMTRAGMRNIPRETIKIFSIRRK